MLPQVGEGEVVEYVVPHRKAQAGEKLAETVDETPAEAEPAQEEQTDAEA